MERGEGAIGGAGVCTGCVAAAILIGATTGAVCGTAVAGDCSSEAAATAGAGAGAAAAVVVGVGAAGEGEAEASGCASALLSPLRRVLSFFVLVVDETPRLDGLLSLPLRSDLVLRSRFSLLLLSFPLFLRTPVTNN